MTFSSSFSSHQQLGQPPRCHFHPPPLLQRPLPPPGPPDTVLRLCLLNICQASIIHVLKHACNISKDIPGTSILYTSIQACWLCISLCLNDSYAHIYIYICGYMCLKSAFVYSYIYTYSTATFTTTYQLLWALGSFSFSHHHRAVPTKNVTSFSILEEPNKTMHIDPMMTQEISYVGKAKGDTVIFKTLAKAFNVCVSLSPFSWHFNCSIYVNKLAGFIVFGTKTSLRQPARQVP